MITNECIIGYGKRLFSSQKTTKKAKVRNGNAMKVQESKKTEVFNTSIISNISETQKMAKTLKQANISNSKSLIDESNKQKSSIKQTEKLKVKIGALKGERDPIQIKIKDEPVRMPERSNLSPEQVKPSLKSAAPVRKSFQTKPLS